MSKGKVYLVGAGPGAPDLLTVRAVDLLKKAEVILHDKLVQPETLAYAGKNAEIIDVGKKWGKFDQIQTEINQLMVKYAKAGKLVVRLKGGDPLIFGRAGEEIDHLVKNGVDFEIIPGISSALGGPALAGIPLTWPGISSTFAISTGHPRATKDTSQVPVPKSDTIVYLMGLKNIKEVVKALLAEGWDKQTPAAVVQAVSTQEEKTLISTIETLVSDTKKGGIAPPAIIIVGKVVTLRGRFNKRR